MSDWRNSAPRVDRRPRGASAITPSAVQASLASGQLASVYLILGDDEHQKIELAWEFEQIVDEGLRAFNVNRFYGGETSVGSILDAARTLPMMASRRVVIVLRAERVLQPKRESADVTHDAEALETFVNQPPPETILVLVSAALDERRRLTKRLLACATVVRCGEIETLADVQRFIRAKVKDANKQITADAVRLLSERIGPDVTRLRDEVERLLLFVGDRSEVSVGDVRDVAGQATAYDDWAVTRAIERGNAVVALRELGRALEQGAVPYVVLGQLAWVARTRLPPVGMSTAIDAVFQTDVSLKRSGGDPRVLLERLVVQLCDAAGRRAGQADADGVGPSADVARNRRERRDL